MSKFKSLLLMGLVMAMPLLAFAQINNLDEGFGRVLGILNRYIVPLIVGIAVVMFLWGLIKYVTAGGDDDAKKAARGTILYGIIIIAVMVSVWGLVRILTGTLGGDQQRPVDLPDLPQTN